MRPLRLFIVATALVALLSLVAGLAAENERVNPNARTRTTETTAEVRAPRAPSSVVEAKVPREKPIVVREGDTVELLVSLKETDTLTIDDFGLDETIGGGLPTPITFVAITPGTYDLKLQNSGGRIGQLVVRPAKPASEGSGGTTPAPTTPEETPAVADPAAA
jgi:hypothetical protein